MFFDALGSLPLGTAPTPVVIPVPPVPSGGGVVAGGGSMWDDRFHTPRRIFKKKELTEAEMMAILLAANEEYFN